MSQSICRAASTERRALSWALRSRPRKPVPLSVAMQSLTSEPLPTTRPAAPVRPTTSAQAKVAIGMPIRIVPETKSADFAVFWAERAQGDAR